METLTTAAPQSYISGSEEVFSSQFNQHSYEFFHQLAGHPAFEISRLVDLAERVAARKSPHQRAGDAYFNNAEVSTSDKPDSPGLESEKAVDLVRRIENSQAWIILKHIEREEGYQEILEQCILDALRLSHADILRRTKWFEAILFITSPNRVTEYHIDREVSWLLQIAGDKDIHIFNRADKDVVPEEELERYWTENNRGAIYKPHLESHASVYAMRAGTGVHIPMNCPHWLKNHNNVSITLNVNFQFKDKYFGNLYRANYHLRRRGLRPSPPGQNPAGDWAKRTAFTALQWGKRALKGTLAIPPEAVEQNRRIAALAERL